MRGHPEGSARAYLSNSLGCSSPIGWVESLEGMDAETEHLLTRRLNPPFQMKSPNGQPMPCVPRARGQPGRVGQKSGAFSRTPNPKHSKQKPRLFGVRSVSRVRVRAMRPEALQGEAGAFGGFFGSAYRSDT